MIEITHESQPIERAADLVVFGVGHSGTTALTRVLHALGWEAGDADVEYAESVSIRAINEQALGGGFDTISAERALASLRRPFAIKDPRFVHTIDLWLPAFRPYEPILVWITRDPAAVARSYSRGDWVARSRRGSDAPVPDPMRFGLTVEETTALAREHFERWPWHKIGVSYERLLAAAETVRVSSSIPATAVRPLSLFDGKCQWQDAVRQSSQDLAGIIPIGATFIFVDQNQIGQLPLGDRRSIPFLERQCQYWGPPADDQTAIREVERLRQAGASCIVFAWPAFWWLEHYAEFHCYLDSSFRCLLKNDRLVVFDLRCEQQPPRACRLDAGEAI